MDAKTEGLLASLAKGDRRSAGQLMTLIENEGPGSEEALKALYASETRAVVVGITGWPGAGKSTLVSRIAAAFLAQGKRVGIIAVDPSSPLSGGGLLGDRIRFRGIEGNDHLFIRSVATRGHQGGLSRAARAFVRIMEAMGQEIVLLETVGIGQDQITVSLVADTTIVVTAPGLGDSLQAIKSGILEVGDIFAVNKADRPDAERTMMLREKDGWCPPVLKTVAADGTGVEALIEAIARHSAHRAAENSMLAGKVRAATDEIREAVKSRLLDHFCGREALNDEPITRYARGICERTMDPYIVADTILGEKGII
jgi:LAO/AO transport system kinase